MTSLGTARAVQVMPGQGQGRPLVTSSRRRRRGRPSACQACLTTTEAGVEGEGMLRRRRRSPRCSRRQRRRQRWWARGARMAGAEAGARRGRRRPLRRLLLRCVDGYVLLPVSCPKMWSCIDPQHGVRVRAPSCVCRQHDGDRCAHTSALALGLSTRLLASRDATFTLTRTRTGAGQGPPRAAVPAVPAAGLGAAALRARGGGGTAAAAGGGCGGKRCTLPLQCGP